MTEPRAGSSRGSQYGSFESGPTHPLFENTITMYTREVEWLLNEALRKTGKGELTLSQTGPKRTIEEQNHARLIARDSNILHLLAALPDICLVFTELCRLTEIKVQLLCVLASKVKLVWSVLLKLFCCVTAGCWNLPFVPVSPTKWTV